MINLGRFKATGLPEVYIRPAIIDRIMIALSIITMVAIWVLITLYYVRNPETKTHQVLVWGGGSILLNILILLSLRMPMRMFNFPFRVNEYNIGRQLFLAKRFVCIFMFELNLVMLIRTVHNFGICMRQLDIAGLVLLGVLLVCFLVYFIFAFRWR